MKEETQCPICLSIMNQTFTTSECCHRFCKDCIDKTLRVNTNACPTCRNKIGNRRTLREDQRFDRLIEAIYGDTSTFEKELLRAEGEATRKRQKDVAGRSTSILPSISETPPLVGTSAVSYNDPPNLSGLATTPSASVPFDSFPYTTASTPSKSGANISQ